MKPLQETLNRPLLFAPFNRIYCTFYATTRVPLSKHSLLLSKEAVRHVSTIGTFPTDTG
jgi:hydrogenase maturation factor